LFFAADQQLFTASVQYGIVDDLQLAQLAHELDIAKHLALGQVFGILFEVAGCLLILLRNLHAILELHAALVEQQSLKGASNGVRGIKIGGFVHKELAHLCIHRRILRLIKGFFEDQDNNTFENGRGVESDVQDIIDKLFELFWGQLVKDTAHLSKNGVIMNSDCIVIVNSSFIGIHTINDTVVVIAVVEPIIDLLR
jgi:hypothetical protein